MKRLLSGLTACAGLLAPPTFAADLPGDPEAGQTFANGICTECHLVDAKQILDPGVGPSFYDIADRDGTTALSLRVFLQTPHLNMPNLILTPEQSDDVISYILSLQDR